MHDWTAARLRKDPRPSCKLHDGPAGIESWGEPKVVYSRRIAKLFINISSSKLLYRNNTSYTSASTHSSCMCSSLCMIPPMLTFPSDGSWDALIMSQVKLGGYITQPSCEEREVSFFTSLLISCYLFLLAAHGSHCTFRSESANGGHNSLTDI